MTTFIMQKLSTKHDANGNPRRVIVFSEVAEYARSDDRSDYYGNDGYTHIVYTHDEGYAGHRAAIEQFRKRGYVGSLIDHGNVDTDVSTYRRLVKWAPDA